MRRRPAQVAVLFAILLPVVLGLLGLVYSVGFVLVERRALQAAADAASTAGAWELLLQVENGTLDDSAVNRRVQEYASLNGVASSQVAAVYTDAHGARLSVGSVLGSQAALPSAARGVQVTLHASVATLLPAFVGSGTILTTAQATAAAVPIASPASADHVVPVGVSARDVDASLASGSTYNLFAPKTPPCSGCAPMLDYAGSDEDDAFESDDRPRDYGYCCGGRDSTGPLSILTNLQYWSDGEHEGGTLKTGGHVALAPTAPLPGSAFGSQDEQIGAFQSVVGRGLLDRLTASRGGPSLLTLPVFDSASGSVHVVGFARFRLTQATSTSAVGVFVPYPAGYWAPPGPAPTTDVGARVVRLIA